MVFKSSVIILSESESVHGSDAHRSESDARQACRWIITSKETAVTHFLSLPNWNTNLSVFHYRPPSPTTTVECVRVSETSICCLMFQLTKFRLPKYRQTLQNAFCLRCACFIFLSIFNQHRERKKKLSDPQTLVKIIIKNWNNIRLLKSCICLHEQIQLKHKFSNGLQNDSKSVEAASICREVKYSHDSFCFSFTKSVTKPESLCGSPTPLKSAIDGCWLERNDLNCFKSKHQSQ